MDNSICLALERMLDEKGGDPLVLPFSFLKATTEDFSENQLIGGGGFGSVYKAKLPNRLVAVKKLRENIQILEKNFKSEVGCLIQVKHKNIVQFLGYCSETQHVMVPYEGNLVWADVRQRLFCFEYLSKGNLANYLTEASSGLQWSVRFEIIKGICEGVHHLHQQKLVHMDLKPHNILLDDNMIPKIADFGLSRRLREDQSKIITEEKVGSRGYLAPEFLEKGIITLEADIYSLGEIIQKILMGCKEWPNIDKVLESWMNMFGTSENHPLLLEQVKVCAEIGINCKDDDPIKRPAIKDIIHRLDQVDISSSSIKSAESPSSSGRVLESSANALETSQSHPLLEQVCAHLGINCVDDDPRTMSDIQDIIRRLDEMDISYSRSFDRSFTSTSSAAQLVDDELEFTIVPSALSQIEQSMVGRFYEDCRLAKKASRPAFIDVSKALGETSTELVDDKLEFTTVPSALSQIEQSKKACRPASIGVSNALGETRTELVDDELEFTTVSSALSQIEQSVVGRFYKDCRLAKKACRPTFISVSNALGETTTEQQQPPVDTGVFEILMFAMSSESIVFEDLISSISKDDPTKFDDDLFKRVENLGVKVHAAMVTTVVACPPRDFQLLTVPKIVSKKRFLHMGDMDAHPTQPWILVGHDIYVSIWHYEKQEKFVSLDVMGKACKLCRIIHGEAEVKSVRFIPRRHWFVAGDYSGYIYVYTCHTWKETKRFRASSGASVVSIAIHPIRPCLLSACEDGVIKLWDWEMGWVCSREYHHLFPGNTTVGQVLVKFNPKDTDMFTSHDQYGALKVWSIYPSAKHITTIKQNSSNICDHVFAETAGGNHLVNIAHNSLIIRDLKTPVLHVRTLYDTRCLVTALACHPTLPLIAAGIKINDITHAAIRFWNSTNYRLVKTVSCTSGSMIKCLGFLGSNRLMIRTEYRETIEVLEIDMESLVCPQ